eukprot:s3484_g3.t1
MGLSLQVSRSLAGSGLTFGDLIRASVKTMQGPRLQNYNIAEERSGHARPPRRGAPGAGWRSRLRDVTSDPNASNGLGTRAVSRADDASEVFPQQSEVVLSVWRLQRWRIRRTLLLPELPYAGQSAESSEGSQSGSA